MPEAKRQLAAIMFTDIVGYTALMGKDSDKALEIVRISKEIQKPLVEKHNGKWLKEMGDGAMAQFSSALDAVNCSIEIQESARAKLDGKLRIGIHSGDITIEDDDVYGDGVNVASRLESIADPGGIYISDAIEKAIQGQSNVQAKYLGEVKLKNVAYGVRTYALQGVGLPVPEVQDEKQVSGHFMAEMQRRGVIRAGATYVVLSLLLILLVPYANSIINLPEWSTTALRIILIVGLPIALYLAWNYERSPEGFVRTSSKESWQNPYKAGQRKPLTSNFIIAAMTLIILAMFIYPRFQPNISEDGEMEVAVTIDNKTLAVIPFLDMSQERDQEWFSDGMMEEILNHLVQIEDLKVTSRTSAMRFKGSEKSLQEIGKELGVAYILEGSVRKQGNKVRITVQLIDVESDQHKWSHTYDQNLDDVFAIQSQVAQNVASLLQAEIQPEIRARIETQPTTSTEAYNLYLQASFLRTLGSDQASDSALILLEKAIEIDPEFADAWVDIGINKILGTTWSARRGGMDQEDALSEAEYHIGKALEIDPNNFNAHVWQATYHLWLKWDFEFANQEFEKSRKLNPGWVGNNYTDLLLASERYEEALANSIRGIQLDPLNENPYRGKILSHYFLGQVTEALNTIELGFNSHFNSPNFIMDAGRAYLYLGKYDAVVETLANFLELYKDTRSPRPLGTFAIAYYHLGQSGKTKELLKEIKAQAEISPGGSPSFYVAMIYAQMGEIDTAFEWLNKAYEDHELEMYWLKVEPPFEPLYDDPRWQEMLDKVGFSD